MDLRRFSESAKFWRLAVLLLAGLWWAAADNRAACLDCNVGQGGGCFASQQDADVACGQVDCDEACNDFNCEGPGCEGWCWSQPEGPTSCTSGLLFPGCWAYDAECECAPDEYR